jgi:uncharacterized protein with PIN domain
MYPFTSPSKCPQCDKTSFEIVPASVKNLATNQMMNGYFDFIRCSACKSVVGVTEPHLSQKLNEIAEMLSANRKSFL